MNFAPRVSADDFHQAKRQRIVDLRNKQATMPIAGTKGTAPPKPLVSAPTSHHELSGFMPGRLEFETEHEQDAEVLTKDMEFGKVYRFGGELLPSEEQALGGKAEQGRSRMEASGRGGVSSRGAGGATAASGKGVRGSAGEGDDDEAASQAQDAPKTDGDDDEDVNADDEAADQTQGGDKDDDDDDANETRADETQDTTMAAPTSAPAADESSQAPAAAAPPPAAAAAPAAPADTPTESTERPPADWDEDPSDLELKLMILEMYNERLERRTERKSAILERGLVEVRRRMAAERRRSKEDRDILSRVRHFSQLQTPQDFEDFYEGLCYQETLRRLAMRLQEYRSAGVMTLSEAARYEVDKEERMRRLQQIADGEYVPPAGAKRSASLVRKPGARDSETPFGDDFDDLAGPSSSTAAAAGPSSSSTSAAAAASSSGKASGSGPTTKKDGPPKSPRKPPRPLDLSSHPSLHLLTRAEQNLCSVQRIQPAAFLVMKKEILTEFIRRNGRMSRRESRQLFKMDVNKVGKVYDLLEQCGYLEAAKAFGWSGGERGVGVPPGWKSGGVNGETNGAGASSAGRVNGSGSTSTPPPPGAADGSRPSPAVGPSPLRHQANDAGGGPGPSSLSQQTQQRQQTASPFRPTART